MRNLKKANILPKDLLKKVIESKKGANKKRLEDLQEELEERFDEYSQKADSNKLHLLAEKWHYDKLATSSDGYFLYHQYDNSNGSMSYLRTKMIEANNGEIVLKCPICELRDTTDLDHYVPRQLFPEFSIHSSNLILTCHECNNKKLLLWCDNGKRLFFNAYYDTPTDEVLFDVTVKQENNILRMELALKSFVNPKEETRIALSTITSLGLMPYVNQKINENFNKELLNIVRYRKRSKETDEEFLLMQKDILTEAIGDIDDVNNWDRIIFETIKDNPIVESWLKAQFVKKVA